MKFIITSDWHLTDKTPENRQDDYPSTQENKVLYTLDYALNTLDCQAILHGGDVFDKSSAPYKVTNKYVSHLKHIKSIGMEKPNIIAVPGQHDLPYHSVKSFPNSPFATLAYSGIIGVADSAPVKIIQDNQTVCIYGCWWNQEIPEPVSKDTFNILIMHRLVSPKELWFGQEGITYSSNLIRELKYDLIVTGDNHKTFTERYRKRVLANPGSLMRKKSDQMDHKPCFMVFDTETLDLETVYIPVEPIEDVMDIEALVEEKVETEELNRFVDALVSKRKEGGVKFDFVSKMNNALEELGDPEVESFIDEVFEEVTDVQNNG